MDEPVRVGLVGAGPWAGLFTAPLLAAGPACTLTAVWARRGELAQQLATRHGAVAVAAVEDLFERCDAIAFAVPPDVQADLAGRAAAAGLPVLLDKPTGLDVAQAERLADEIAASGVASQVILTNRYRPTMRAFLDAAQEGTRDRRAGDVPRRRRGRRWLLRHAVAPRPRWTARSRATRLRRPRRRARTDRRGAGGR